MSHDWRCPICGAKLTSWAIESGNVVVEDGLGNLAVMAGDPRETPSVKVACGNGCALAVKGRERVDKVVEMMNPKPPSALRKLLFWSKLKQFAERDLKNFRERHLDREPRRKP